MNGKGRGANQGGDRIEIPEVPAGPFPSRRWPVVESEPNPVSGPEPSGRFRRLGRVMRILLLAPALGMALAALLWHLFPYSTAPLEHYPASTYLLDRYGEPLRMLLGPGELHSDPVPFTEMGTWTWKALVAVEDKRFFDHPGLDLLAIARATAQNLSHARVLSGASTLSSQVVRMTEPRARTLPAKVIEGFRTLQMDAQLTKTEILTQYVNRAPMGGNLAGVAAASRVYFAKDPADLSLPEAALLMGLPQSPSRYRPTRHPERAQKRRHAVLRRMLACGYITPAQFQSADQTPVKLRALSPPFSAPHFCELACRRLNRAPRPAAAPHRIPTTLDLPLQRLAENRLGRHAAQHRAQGVNGGAVVILEVKTGAIRAWVGSPDFRGDDGQVDGVIALRSPGSTLKPFAYALAMDRGQITPETVIPNGHLIFQDYRPENFDRQFSGDVTVRQALGESLNIPALQVTRNIGLDPILSTLRALGLHSIDQPAKAYGLSLVLGTAEVSLVDLVAAYGALAREGVWLPWRIWEESEPVPGHRVFSAGATYLIADMLERGSRLLEVCGHAADSQVPPVAWKTGTSSGRRDAWTIAYNPEYVVGVWIGNPEGEGASILTGTTAAAPLAYEIFRSLYPDGAGPWFAPPNPIQVEEVCPVTGRLPGHRCTQTVDGLRIRGVSDPGWCEAHDPPPPVSPPPRITSPVGGTRYRMVGRIPDDQQAIALHAESADSAELHWFVDGRHLGSAPSHSTLLWPLAPGTHTLSCADSDGRADAIRIHVQP